MAYAAIEPWGEEQANWRAGLITSTIANVHRDSRKKPQPFTPEDFMPHERLATTNDVAEQERIEILRQRAREFTDRFHARRPE